MEILGIGPLELLLIIVIMLIVLGPKEMVKTGYQVGRLIRKIINSPAWGSVMNASREIREMPTRFVRESGLDEDIEAIRRQTRDSFDPIYRPSPHPRENPPIKPENGSIDGRNEPEEPPQVNP